MCAVVRLAWVGVGGLVWVVGFGGAPAALAAGDGVLLGRIDDGSMPMAAALVRATWAITTIGAAGAKRTEPYVLQAHYFARGPMGFGMGKLQVIDHAGDGNLTFAEHPFVIMKDKAFVELARTGGATAATALQIAR